MSKHGGQGDLPSGKALYPPAIVFAAQRERSYSLSAWLDRGYLEKRAKSRHKNYLV